MTDLSGEVGVTPKQHALKTIQPHFDALWSGSKTFEYRVNDRGFNPGDLLLLREYDAPTGTFTDRVVYAEVGYLLSDPDGNAIMSLLKIRRYPK